MIRGRFYESRLGVGSAGIDPKLIDDIPADWADKLYVLAALPDPDDPTKPAAQWVDISSYLSAPGGAGWGIHGTYIMGTL